MESEQKNSVGGKTMQNFPFGGICPLQVRQVHACSVTRSDVRLHACALGVGNSTRFS